ncbi:MAG: S41 family peptidase, partial [Planctomycetes bacterium]|nr:S41 family peptidase [Planctomycetota bacterium]
ALAEMGAFSGIKAHLKELEKEPGERGRLARAYLKLCELTDQLERELANKTSGAKYDYRLLDEVIEALKANYHDPAKIDEAKLIESAARGICGSLDPYTSYYDEKTIEILKKEELGGKYGGIGARVAMRKDKSGNSWLTITEPIYSGPAYRNGLRSNDMIVEIEGESTANREVDELVRRLRGQPGTKVTFKVLRRGWQKEREYSIAREEIQLETTQHRMLPGRIGYVKLTTFGEQDIDLVENAVRELKDQGMKALVFDLRGNSGGYLKTAIKIASYFLERGQVVVSTRSRGEERDKRTADGNKITDAPVFMLVDDGSASASEILAGALRDHGRAVLIGEKTYGKGSVQDLKYLKTTDEKTAVRVTIAKWFLPKGQSVEKDTHKESGIEPDIKAAAPERDLWKEAEFERLRSGDLLDGYLKEHYDKDRDLFKKLAESDGNDCARYPGFDALYDSLKTRASKDEVREVLREYVRRRVQDEAGKPLYFDFQTDVVLQRAILESCKKASIDPKSVKEYESFAKAEK